MSFFSILFYCALALSHAEIDANSPESSALYAQLLNAAINLDLKENTSTPSPQAKISLDGKIKKLVLGKNYIDLDSNGFWLMADALSQLYLNELKNACEECNLPSKEDILKEVQNKIAQGWISKSAIVAGDIIVERYGLEFANLRYRYGLIAGILKVVGEIVEDAVLVVFKMPGAHFLCELITAYIAVNSKAFNTGLRGFTLPRYYNNSRILSTARLFATSYVVRRALKRIDIEVPAFTVNQEALDEFLHDNEETKLYDKFLDYSAHKIENAGMESLAENMESYLAKRHRFNRFISRLDSQLNKVKNKINKKNLTDLEKQQLIEQSSVLTRIRKKSFEGKRYKRFLFLKSRKQKDSLGEFTKSQNILGGSEFWFFSLKNDLLMPNLHFLNNKKATPLLQKSLPEDALTQWQINNSEANNTDLLEKTFASISTILDPKKNTAERYLHLKMLDSYTTTVLPKLSLKLINKKIDELDFNKSSVSEAGSVWKMKFQVYKRLSLFNKRLDIYSDILRYGAINRKSIDPTMPYHAREYYLSLMKVFETVTSFADIEGQQDIPDYIKKFDAVLKDLDRNRYWVEKKKRSLSINGLRGVYSCEALY